MEQQISCFFLIIEVNCVYFHRFILSPFNLSFIEIDEYLYLISSKSWDISGKLLADESARKGSSCPLSLERSYVK